MEAFRDRDRMATGKDTIPISGVGFQIFNYFKAAYGFVDDYDIVDGKLRYFPMEADYKNYMDTLNRFYTDNLIDHEMMFQTDEQFKAKARTRKVGVFAYTWCGYCCRHRKSKMVSVWCYDSYHCPFALSLNICSIFSVFQNCAMITKANKHIDESLLFLDFLYTDTEPPCG